MRQYTVEGNTYDFVKADAEYGWYNVYINGNLVLHAISEKDANELKQVIVKYKNSLNKGIKFRKGQSSLKEGIKLRKGPISLKKELKPRRGKNKNFLGGR